MLRWLLKLSRNACYEAVLDILTGDAINFISEVYGDVEGYITNSIEAQVNLWKENK